MQLINFYITSTHYNNCISISIKNKLNSAYIKIINTNDGIEHVFNDTHSNCISFLSNLFETIDKTIYSNIQVNIPFSVTRNITITNDPQYMQNINDILHIYSKMITSNGEIFLGYRQYRD
jgi:hypothetical protein